MPTSHRLVIVLALGAALLAAGSGLVLLRSGGPTLETAIAAEPAAATTTTTTVTAAPVLPDPVERPDTGSQNTVADLGNGEVLGHPIGSSSTDLLPALDATFGDTDDGGGWDTPCGWEEQPELHVTAGGVFFRFVGDGDTDHLVGWQVPTNQAVVASITLPGATTTAMSMVELAGALGEDLQVIPEWDSSRLWVAGPDTNPFFVGSGDIDRPADLMGHGDPAPDCYDY